MGVDHLLIDGKNSIYRSVFAGYVDSRFKESGHDYFVIFMRFLANYINRFRPKSVHVFWDSKTSWRRNVYPTYKIQRVDQYKDHPMDVKSELRRQMMISIEALRNLNVRQYYENMQEADDLIYAFVKNNLDKQCVIVSADADFKQITYRLNNIKIFNPLSKKDGYEDIPEMDPILIKSFTGDKSDNITGYYGIGKVKVKPLVSDMKAREEFFSSDRAIVMKNGSKIKVGKTVFVLNKQIIDLDLNPYLNSNLELVNKLQLGTTTFSLDKLKEVILKYKLRGLTADLSNLSLPFKNLT